MGYTPTRTLYKLDFSETEHAGLEVTTRSMSVDGLLKIATLVEGSEDSGRDEGQVREMLRRFASVLVDWNVETDDGAPVPADLDGLTSQDIDFVVPVISRWLSAMTQAPRPLPGPSPNGASPTPEDSLGLASLSAPLPSLSVPG